MFMWESIDMVVEWSGKSKNVNIEVNIVTQFLSQPSTLQFIRGKGFLSVAVILFYLTEYLCVIMKSGKLIR